MAATLGGALSCRRASETAVENKSTAPPAPAPPLAGDAGPAGGASSPQTSALPQATTPEAYAWQLATARVEEVRGGGGAVMVPSELRHYDDRRRFLAVQMADSRQENFTLPHDHGELAQMIRRGDLVELPALSDDHMLYEVGTDAQENPLAHYDKETGKDVPLLSREEYEAEQAAPGKTAERVAMLQKHYGSPQRREQLFREREAVDALASDFGGLRYDLQNPDDRARFQVRLLSFVRPEARDTVQRLAKSYHERFGRPLPVSSLVRTQRYQNRLARNNRNATRVAYPPHTTGMAFDITYKYMANDEQNFVMDQIAQLERSGQAEALRENNGCYHVYTLTNGRPADTLVADFLSVVDQSHGRVARVANVAKNKVANAAKKKTATVRKAAAKPTRKAARRTRARRAR